MRAPQTSWEKPREKKRTDSESSGHSIQDGGTLGAFDVTMGALMGCGGGLPPNWEEFYDDDGTAYYVNSKSGETSWDKPSQI